MVRIREVKRMANGFSDLPAADSHHATDHGFI